MKKIAERLLAGILKLILSLRYRIEVVGLEKINADALPHEGGVLFLTSHPTIFIDPIIAGLSVFPSYRIRPMIIDYMYKAPVINSVARFLRALPIPNFYVSSNSLKKRRSERVFQEIAHGLRQGEHFMLAPAGKVKISSLEKLGGTSAVHRILQEAPQANVVLIRTKGLYGSSFSTYHTGESPSMLQTLLWGGKQCLKNLLFFTPKRRVVVEVELAPADFPFGAGRIELNRYLEKWFNKPDGFTKQEGECPGDSLMLVSYSMWGEKLLPVQKRENAAEEFFEAVGIPEEVRKQVSAKVAALTDRPPETIKPEMHLTTDLGMDSLDTAELSAFLQDTYELGNIPINALTTVGKAMGVAAGQVAVAGDDGEKVAPVSAAWARFGERLPLEIPPGQTIPEAFFKNCDLRKHELACADETSGAVSYSQLKLRIVLLADYIQKLSGEYIGILLPATVAANAVILAVQLAGKVPVPINWTVGPRHVETVLQLSDLKTVLTSEAFLDRLDNVDLTLLEPYLVMLEDMRKQFSLLDKLKAFLRSKRKAASLLKVFGADKLDGSSKGALLFTSGTESMPKGVPLTYDNLMSNLRGAIDVVKVSSADVLFGILPPFHSFGFTVCGVCALLAGIRVAYFPNPTDGKKLASAFEKWNVTTLVGPPTFIRGVIKGASPGQLRTLRICISGAEKAPPELFSMVEGCGGKLLEGYGITECSPVLTMNPMVGKVKGVGVAFPDVEVAIVHPDTYEELPRNTQGMIVARGKSIFSGYLNPGAASPFIELRGTQWYKTGDLGVLDEDGYLTITGRLKRFVKIGGEMVSLAAIEEALLQEAPKRGWPTQEEGPALAACATEEAGEKTKIILFTRFGASPDEVNASLKAQGFSNLVRVSAVKCLPEIPVTGTGKINYRALEHV